LSKKNLRFLAERQKLEEVRIVCHEQEVDVEQAIAGIAKTVPEYLDTFTLKLIRFRRYGVRGRLEHSDSPTDEQMERWSALARPRGFGKVKTT
jgi:pyruvate formate lyase activating enzyme